MDDTSDAGLLEQFTRTKSQDAFAELVRRHIALVHSVALRHTDNPQHAQEITQAVFIILARKAASLGRKTALSGWLYHTARLTAANFRRAEFRRIHREQEAFMQSTLEEPSQDAVWRELAPLLDEAMAHLGATDRDVVLLRYFENKSLSEVGRALGMKERTAQKRVTRALEKLRKIFNKRGVTLTTKVIAGALAANSLQAAPAALTVTISAMTAQGALLSATISTLVKGTMRTMTWVKIKFATGFSFAVILACGVATLALSGGSGNRNVAQNEDSVLIVPGVSVGKVRKGMTTNEVQAVLGRPEKWVGRMMIYDRKLGMSVGQSQAGALAVLCGDSMLKYPGVKKFKGRTKEGIGMESGRENVIKAFGQPTGTALGNLGQETLEYIPLGLTFALEGGKVFHITVDFRVPQAPAGAK